MSAKPVAPRIYDKGGEDNRRKHGWGNAFPGFVEVAGEIVGKCPNGLDLDLRTALLQDAIPVDEEASDPTKMPTRLYIVYNGAVYRAKPTNFVAGSWHAFPETARELRKLSVRR